MAREIEITRIKVWTEHPEYLSKADIRHAILSLCYNKNGDGIVSSLLDEAAEKISEGHAVILNDARDASWQSLKNLKGHFRWEDVSKVIPAIEILPKAEDAFPRIEDDE